MALVTKIFTGLLLLSMIGCASYPPAPLTIEGKNTNYLIGPGDTIDINVWGKKDVSKTTEVRPDGKISSPLVQDLQASNKTPSQLAQDITKILSQYIKSPLVTVTVSGFVGTFGQQIRVVGEATTPQSLPYRENMTMLDAMIAVGGLTEFADGDKARIIRIEGDQKVQYNVALERLLREGDIDANVQLAPGDIIIIPEAWY